MIVGRLIHYKEGRTLMNLFASILFYAGAVLMLFDAVSYSLGAIRAIRAGVKAPNAYWDRRLLLNLLLANMGLYFTGLFTLIGAFLAGPMPGAAHLLLLLSIVLRLYRLASMLLPTPNDSPPP